MAGAQKSILIVGDSLSFPRAHKGQLLSQTWPSILHQKLGAFVWNRSKTASTVRDALVTCREIDHYLAMKEPQFVLMIVQIGIVDATPRPFSLGLTRILASLPRGGGWLSKRLIEAKSFLTCFENKPWITEREFSESVTHIAELGLQFAEKVVFLAIAPPMHYMRSSSLGSVDSVPRYNEIMRQAISNASKGECARILVCNPWLGSCDNLILPDGHHLTIEGHRCVARSLLKIVDLLPSR